jgi:hypothetical protein
MTPVLKKITLISPAQNNSVWHFATHCDLKCLQTEFPDFVDLTIFVSSGLSVLSLLRIA